MKLKEALTEMDALDDDQWTADGAPKLNVLSETVGEKVSRQDVIDAAPEFSKDNMEVPDIGVPEEVPEEDFSEAEASMEGIEKYLERDPMPEAKFVPFLMSLDPGVLNTMDEVLAEQLIAAEQAITLATDLKNRIKRSRAFTKARIKREVPDMSNQQAIQHFIKSQTEARGAKIRKTRELLKGVDIKMLDPRAPIDRAMARKNSRGTNRPARLLMK